jgi:Endoplasmic Reticulum-Golgi Intermediate Compartment (ERGIC)
MQDLQPQLRFRGKTKSAIERVAEFDAFPKLKESSIKPSAVGGFSMMCQKSIDHALANPFLVYAVTVFSILLIIWLVKSEIMYFWDSRLHFKLQPDGLLNEKLPVNVDITISMPCRGRRKIRKFIIRHHLIC